MLTLRRQGFTLIELLIVVAIIAILAAIAVPNFLEAQVRSKVSRAKNDMRSLATALEAYRTDYSHYVLDRGSYGALVWPSLTVNAPPEPFFVLTTPVAYITSVPSNPFPDRSSPGSTTNSEGGRATSYLYVGDIWVNWMTQTFSLPNPIGQWALASNGPDQRSSYGVYYVWGYDYLHSKKALILGGRLYNTDGCIYDPTNGTIS